MIYGKSFSRDTSFVINVHSIKLSVINQTLKDIKIIYIDNESKDNSLNFLKILKKKKVELRLFILTFIILNISL